MANIRKKGERSALVGSANVPCKLKTNMYKGQQYSTFKGVLRTPHGDFVLEVKPDLKTDKIVTTSRAKDGSDIPTIWVRVAEFLPSNRSGRGGRYE